MDDMISGAGRSFSISGAGRRLFRALAGLGGVVGLGAVAFLPTMRAAEPDAGHLPPLRAVAAEESRIAVMGWGETFGEVLYGANLDAREQVSLLDVFRGEWDPRRLQSGTEVTIRYARGEQVPRGVDVTVTRDTLLRIDREGEGWIAAKVPIGFTTDTIAVAGEIQRDLWSSLMQNVDLEGMSRGDRAVVLTLVDNIFQSTVDFWRDIYPGDTYRFTMEREVRTDGSIRGTSRILAAEVASRGRPHLAYWFDVHGDGRGGYYDASGASMKRAFLLRPLELGRISSPFAPNRMHPILDVRRPHLGTDIAAPTGTPVMATGDGVITFRGVDGGYGNLVELRHPNGYVTRYAHLSRFGTGQSVGSRVSQSDVIGYVGMTGLATGPHVHYEIYRNGTAFDSRELAGAMPAGDPIPASARDRWLMEYGARHALLETRTGGPDVRLAQAPTDAAGAGMGTGATRTDATASASSQ